jgi:hypothetical protein
MTQPITTALIGCLTVWLSGSGGTGETPSQLCTISGKSRLRGAAEPLSAGAGVRFLFLESTGKGPIGIGVS